MTEKLTFSMIKTITGLAPSAEACITSGNISKCALSKKLGHLAEIVGGRDVPINYSRYQTTRKIVPFIRHLNIGTVSLFCAFDRQEQIDIILTPIINLHQMAANCAVAIVYLHTESNASIQTLRYP